VATAAPLLLVTIGLVLVVLLCLRRSPALTTGSGAVRPRIRHVGMRIASYCLLGVVLWCTLGLPLSGIASWPSKGESSASGTSADQQLVEGSGALFEFRKALDATPGIREQRSRWLQLALATALLAMLIATPLARAATRRGRRWGLVALVAGAVPLAVPGIVLAIGTILLWTDNPLGGANAGLMRPTLVLVARFLPFALLATWLWLRRAPVGREEAGASLGAGPVTRALRIWGPPGIRGVLVGGLLVLILALREFEAVMLIEPRIYLARLYEKIHFSRLADEANLLLLYLLYVLVPVLALGLLLTWRGRRQKA
jgi:ABC-type Fe3+ transport system permease subunit